MKETFYGSFLVPVEVDSTIRESRVTEKKTDWDWRQGFSFDMKTKEVTPLPEMVTYPLLTV